MNNEERKYFSFGMDGNRIYGFLPAREKEALILPECEMRISPEILGNVKFEDQLPESVKENFLKFWDQNGAIDEAGKTVLELYHEFAEELSAKGNAAGLSAKAYGCYGGYNSFDCDWYASRDCLLKLLDVDYKPFYADTLGYIYYYGRCNNGVPEYDKAFKYYSMAAFAGNYEATYKVADMFLNGYFVQKDTDTAYNMLRRLYEENLPFITHGEFLSAFADIAFRMGKLLRNILDMDNKAHSYEVYRYLLQALFAIRMRIATYDQSYGDDKVLQNITNLLNEQREICRPQLIIDGPTYYKAGLAALSLPDSMIRMNVRHGEDSIISFTPVFDDMKNVQPRFLLTLPGEDYCGLCDELVFRVVHSSKAIPEGDFLFDQAEDDGLYMRGQLVLETDAVLELISPNVHSEKEYDLLGVRFEANGEIIDYLTEDSGAQPGDIVTIEGDTRMARVIKVSRRKGSELASPPNSYAHARIVRKKK